MHPKRLWRGRAANWTGVTKSLMSHVSFNVKLPRIDDSCSDVLILFSCRAKEVAGRFARNLHHHLFFESVLVLSSFFKA